MFTSLLQSPIGTISIKADEDFVYSINFSSAEEIETPNFISDLAKLQLNEYFEGKRYAFDFPFKQEGTDFQQKVWDELLTIKAGQPTSYLKLSKQMNNPLAIRAIASANGKNKLMIVVPCHRVIGSTGELVGYAGELWRKKWLLEHEARMMNSGQSTLIF